MKTTIKLSDNVIQKFAAIRKETAAAIAGAVAQSFEEILNNSPQYSGQFVASMAIGAGAGKKSLGSEISKFPIPKNAQEAFGKGSQDAINHALNNNRDIVKSLTAGITKGAGWLPVKVTIYNNLEDAEIVEGLDQGELRSVNEGAAHPIQKGVDIVESNVAKILFYGSPQFLKAAADGKNPF